MDVIAYWIYASLQSVCIVAMFDIRGEPKRMVALAFFTLFAPLATAMLAYLAMGKFLDWMQAGQPK